MKKSQKVELKPLHLNINKDLFELIASGEKVEDYRELELYSVYRLFYKIEGGEWHPKTMITDSQEIPLYPNSPKCFSVGFFDYYGLCVKEFTHVVFKCGNKRNSPTIRIEWKGLRIGGGNSAYGAEVGKRYFIIDLGEVVGKEHLKCLKKNITL